MGALSTLKGSGLRNSSGPKQLNQHTRRGARLQGVGPLPARRKEVLTTFKTCLATEWAAPEASVLSHYGV